MVSPVCVFCCLVCACVVWCVKYCGLVCNSEFMQVGVVFFLCGLLFNVFSCVSRGCKCSLSR